MGSLVRGDEHGDQQSNKIGMLLNATPTQVAVKGSPVLMDPPDLRSPSYSFPTEIGGISRVSVHVL